MLGSAGGAHIGAPALVQRGRPADRTDRTSHSLGVRDWLRDAATPIVPSTMTNSEETPALTVEQRARVLIDRQLRAAGWAVQDRGQANLELPGVAVREAVMATGHGRADYLLYVDRRAVGVIEAKPEGTTLSGVEWQSARYATGRGTDTEFVGEIAAQQAENPLESVG